MTRTLALILALALSAPALGASPLSGSAKVIDGDSLRLGSVEVRLWGIQAPEWDTSAGAIATTFLRGLTWRKSVRCWTFYHDRHERAVAQCWIGDIDLARAMVDSGNAVDWPKYSGGHYAE